MRKTVDRRANRLLSKSDLLGIFASYIQSASSHSWGRGQGGVGVGENQAAIDINTCKKVFISMPSSNLPVSL